MVHSSSPGAFPNLYAVLRLVGENDSDPRKQSKLEKEHVDISHIYDVSFYPYTHPDDEAVFAVVFIRSVYVFRTSADPKNPVQVLAVFEDPKTDVYYDLSKDPDLPIKFPLLAKSSLNSLVWSQDVETGDPLLCFGGSGTGDIKVVNVVKKTFVRNISGHGGPTNDLAISPLTPTILASASADFSIRLWNLDPKYKHQPCAAILASPDAHKQAVLTTAFHGSGKYLLSGGTDTMINLWPVPDVPDANAGTDKTTCVHFPVFSSNEVHSNYVDCVCFHGDMILSKAAASGQIESKSNHILLWKIDGFSSADPIPDDPPMAKPGLYTRSAFGGRFQRLLTFDMPNSATMYMRFSLFAGPHHHPMLAMGNEKSKVSFWDLQALEDGRRPTSGSHDPAHKLLQSRGGLHQRRGSARRTASSDGKEEDFDASFETAAEDNELSDESDGTNETGTTPSAAGPPTRGGRGGSLRGRGGRGGGRRSTQKTHESRYDVSDPFRSLAPHHTITVPKYNFTIRQMAWSNCGGWCVAGGQLGIICVFRRWAGSDRRPPPAPVYQTVELGEDGGGIVHDVDAAEFMGNGVHENVTAGAEDGD